MLEHLLNFAPTLTSVFMNSPKLPSPVKLNLANLTRLEFAQCWARTSDLPKLLLITAGTLQHLKLYATENADPSDPIHRFCIHSIHFPIMEKLKIFEIVQSQVTNRNIYGNCLVSPAIRFKFQNSGERRLDYPVQFPVLETIRISKMELDPHFSNFGNNVLTKQEYFATSKAFLYNYFLHESNSKGLTVKKLDIPYPPCFNKGIGGERCLAFCDCIETGEISEFWDRVIAIFPNLVRFHAMGAR